MSDEENKVKTESPPLLNYLKQEISLEEIRDYASPKRIESIDFVKGFAIVFIILAHTSGVWLDENWIFMNGIVYLSLDILGPSLFVFLSALSVVFSIKSKKGKLPDKVVRSRIFSRGLMIMAIGVPYNLLAITFTVEGYPFPLNLWGWNILMFIGFSQILSYYALKLGKLARVVIGGVIIFISGDIRSALYYGKDQNPFFWFLHYVITSPAPQVTLFPWLSICFLSTIFGEYLYEAMTEGPGDAYTRLFRIFMFWGIFLVILGVSRGLTVYNPDTLPGGINEYPHLQLLEIANSQKFIPEIKYPGIYEFLIRGREPNMWYNLGCALVLIAVCFYFIDIKRHKNYFINMFKYYGKVSLSLFLIHYAFITLFISQFPVYYFAFAYLAYTGFLGFLMYVWLEYGNGVMSPEWIMIQVGRIGQKTGESVSKTSKKAYEKTVEGLKKTEKAIKKETDKIFKKPEKDSEKQN
ncbi:MAG: conserved membrane protein of unknown function [Promethearchaeota archaeon]|nr:MAG: conserved membrane protein of unknown function [Candidatus Lokiarchaeota archaeon]